MKLKVFREINEAATKYYADKNSFKHDEFLSACNQILCKFFSKYLHDNFIFSTLSFTNKGKLHLVNEKDGNNIYNFCSNVNEWQSLLAKIKSYIKEIEDGKIISLTNVLLDKNIKQDLFLIHADSTYSPTILGDKIQEYKLNAVAFNPTPADFIKENEKCIEDFANKFANPLYTENTNYKYGKYIWNYYELAKDYSTNNAHADFLIHFIKPSIVEFDYNLLLSLATNRLLEDDELAFINLLMHRIVSQTAIEKVEEVKQHATRAAISQVMARNMSHNIGSHVLSKFKNRQDIENLNKPNQYSGNLPNLTSNEQIAYFNDYLKTRMDFLADVTLTTPILETPYKFCSDVLQGFLKNHILLDRISGITGDPKYKIQTRIFNGVNWFDDNLTTDLKTWDNDGFTVSMPNDVLGCHAFYIILENIIRNTYKHSKANLPEFVFNIELKEIENPDLIEVRIYDNNCKPIDKINETVASRNSSFNEELIKGNKLREGSLGTIEMEVCASFLRKISLGEYEKSIYQVNEKGFNEVKGKTVYNLIRAYGNICDDNSGNASLGYVFYLRKPKELLVICDTIQQNDDWKKSGIDVIKKSDLQSESFGHQIILSEESIPKHITHTPRIIQIDTTEIQNLSSVDLIAFSWSKYGNELVGDSDFKFKRKQQKCYFKTENDNNLKVEFFDHGSGYNDAPDKANSYIEASHHHTAKIAFENNKPPSNKNLVGLVELAKTSICLIDERIQTFYLEKSYQGSDGVSIEFKNYFPNIGIHIPTKEEADLNTPNFGEIGTENSVQFNLRKYLTSQEKIDFIILHLGIIEKLIDDKSKEIVEQKIKELLNQNEELYKKVVLTSGRGTPTTIPDNCRYLPLSAVQHCVETTFDKFLLVKALYNSRRTNTN